MWSTAFTTTAKRIESALEREDILRQLGRYCPLLDLPPARTEVWRTTVVSWADQQLVRIVDERSAGRPKVIYGLYAQGDLRPLDREGGALRLAYKVDVPSPQNLLTEDELVDSWIGHVEHQNDEELIFPERVQAALPMWEWHHKLEFGVKVTQVLDRMELLIKYPEKRAFQARLKDAVLRFAELQFYASWRLLEYAGYDEHGHVCRSYALCKEDDGDMTILPLDGSSGPIHSANDHPDELLLDTPERRAAYLRFFCWAIESSEGPFLIPRYRRELDLMDRLDEKVLDVLKPVMDIEELGEDADDEASQRGFASMGEDRRFGRLKAYVVYGTALFQAWFKLERTGGIVMVDDSSLANDLPLLTERFGGARLPILTWAQPSEPAERTMVEDDQPPVQKPIAKYYGHNFLDSRSPRTLSAASFLEELQAGHSAGGDVSEVLRITLDANVQAGPSRFVVYDTHFTGQVDLVNLGSGRSLHFKNCLFDHGIQGHLAELGGDLMLENCSVGPLPDTRKCSYSIDLSDARIRGTLHLLDCHLSHSFLADRIQVEGNLLIWGCFLGGQLGKRELHWRAQELHDEDNAMLTGGLALAPPDRARGLWNKIGVHLSNAVIHGDLELTVMDDDQIHRESTILRDLNWTSAIVCTVARGDLRADGCVVHHNVALGGGVWAGQVNLSHIHCQASLNGHIEVFDEPLNKYRVIGLRIWNDNLNLTNARFDADLRLNCVDVLADDEHKAKGFGDLDLRSTTIGGLMVLMGARITKDLNFDFCEIRDYVNAYHSLDWDFEPRLALHVGNEISMSGANMGSVELRGVRVGQRVRALTGTFGRMLISTGVMPYGKDIALMPVVSQIGALEFSSVTFTGELHLTGIRITSEERSHGGFRRTQSNRGLKITGCSIGGDLLFFQEELKVNLERRWSPTLENRPSWVNPENQDIERSSSDESTARGVTNEPLRTSVMQARTWGDLDLSGTTVGGHLDLRNLSVEGNISLNDLYVKHDLRLDHGHNWEKIGFEDWSDPPRTVASTMTAEKLRCDGDVLMTGLTLGSKDIQAKGAILKAREAQVRGEWLFMPLNHGEQSRAREQYPGTDALLHGGLDLAAAQINHLILGKANFKLPEETPTGQKVVDLERATINRFEIVKPMPRTVDLSRIKVGRWEFNSGTATAQDYLEVLKEMNPFDRSVWVDVERSLRNEARDDDAHEVYRGMREEAARRRNPSSGRFQYFIGTALNNLAEALFWPLLIPFSLLVIVQLGAGALLSLLMNKVRLFTTDTRLVLVEGCWTAIDRTLSRMERWVTAYGTQVWRPMVLWGIFFGVSLWLLRDPSNVELELGPRVVLVQDGRIVNADPLHGIPFSSEAPPGTSTERVGAHPALLQLRRDEVDANGPWTWSDAIFLTLRYHVPVLDLGIQSEWKAGQRELALGPLSFTPEKWAAAAQGYSFIAWSLLLIGLSVQVFRGKQG